MGRRRCLRIQGQTSPPGVVSQTRSRLIAWLLASVVAAFVAAGISAPTASACTETGAFWSDTDTAGNIINPAAGAYAKITQSQHTLKCVVPGGEFGTGQTVRVLVNGDMGHYAEVGWATELCSGGGNCHRAFYSWKWGGVQHYGNHYTYSCLNPGTQSAWRMYWDTYNGWEGDLQCYGTGTWLYVDSYSDPSGYHTGFADNEGFNRGYVGDEGPMAETHSSLMWLNPSTYVWQSSAGSSYPAGVRCRYDTSSRWNGRWLSGTSFDFVTSGGQSC
jgi:hypothetical protein